MQRVQGLSIEDELSLYLVCHRLKPAALITLDPLEFDAGYNVIKSFNGRITRITILEDSVLQLNTHDVSRFNSLLQEFNLHYLIGGQGDDHGPSSVYNSQEKEIPYLKLSYSIGRDQACLDALLAAKSDEQLGLALGYPEDAVAVFSPKKANTDLIALIEAKKANVEFPSWLAYISHYPAHFDLIKGNISQSSKEQGERYQSFVMENNPNLGQRVEQEYRSKILNLPKGYRMMNDGYFVFEYSF